MTNQKLTEPTKETIGLDRNKYYRSHGKTLQRNEDNLIGLELIFSNDKKSEPIETSNRFQDMVKAKGNNVRGLHY